MQKIWMNNKGSTLPMVLAVLIIVVIFSVTALTIGSASIKQAENQEKRVQAYYLARSGANAVAAYITKNPDGLSDAEMTDFVTNLIDESPSGSFKLDAADSGEIRISVTDKLSEGLLVVSSTAEVDGISRTVSVNIGVEKTEGTGTGMLMDKAFYSIGGFTLNQGTIIGPITIITEGDAQPYIIGSRCTINGTVYIEQDKNLVYDNNQIYLNGDPQIDYLPSDYSYPNIDVPEFLTTENPPDHTINSNITLSGNEDEIIFANNLYLNGNLTISRTSGTGVMKIYVKESVNIGGSLSGDPTLLQIYLVNGDNYKMTGNVKFSATLFIKENNLRINCESFSGYVFYWGHNLVFERSTKMYEALVYMPHQYGKVTLPNTKLDEPHTGVIISRQIDTKGSLKYYQMYFPDPDGSGGGGTEPVTSYTIGQWQ